MLVLLILNGVWEVIYRYQAFNKAKEQLPVVEGEKFTGGEWYAKEGQIYPVETGKTLALIPYFDVDNEEHLANQNLIASAPAMYRALKKLVADGQQPRHLTFQEWNDMPWIKNAKALLNSIDNK